MSQLRIFSYLPNPRIWKATIAARLAGVDVEVRGTSPKELSSWLWDFDAHPLSLGEKASFKEVRASVNLARLLRSTDRKPEAHVMLADIYNWFTEGFDTADLKEAKALLEELAE